MAEVKAQMGADFSIGAVAKRLGEEWKGLSAAGKKPYEAQAAADKDRYAAAIAANPEQAPPKRKGSKTKDPKAKRPPSPYILFCKERRPECTQRLKESMGSEFKNTDVLKALGAEWKTLNEEGKARFQKLSKELATA